MGQPNFQRLAELGQLPDYVKPTFNEAIAQVDAMRKEKAKEVKSVGEEGDTEEVVDEIIEEEKEEKKKAKKGKSKKKVFVDNLTK